MKEYTETLLKHIPEEDGYYVYVLLCENHSLYCGWTTNIKKRFALHKSGKGAKYTRMHPPIGVFYYEKLQSKEEALKREYAIKHLTRKEKLALQNPTSVSIQDV